MEFGKISAAEIGKVNWLLPPDHPQNKEVLGNAVVPHPRLYMGGARWTATEWSGILYPKRTRPADFLRVYATQFNSVELNALHYKLYEADELQKWSDAVNAPVEQLPVRYEGDFVFSPKLWQAITHRGSLKGKEALVNDYISSISVIQNSGRVGVAPVLIQLSDQFSPSRQVELLEFLSALPNSQSWMLELRHEEWFMPSVRMEQFYATLRQLNIGLVITDVGGRRDVCHMRLSVPKAMIRFGGNNLHSSDYLRVDAWASRLATWFQQGLQEAYFFFHMSDESTVPALAAYSGNVFRRETGIATALPMLEAADPTQGLLF